MKTLRVLVNNKHLEIHFDYKEESNELFTDIIDSKGNKLDKRKTRIILKELFKGFKVEDSCMALQMLTKKDNPIVLYTDDEGNINPVLFYERNNFDSMDEIELKVPKLKREKILSITSQVTSYFLLLAMLINFCQNKIEEKEFEQTIKASSQTIDDSFNENYLQEMILFNENLSDEDKELLSSSSFLRDIANTNLSLHQKAILSYQLRNLSINEYNAVQKSFYYAKEMMGKDNLYGYVLDKEYLQDTIYLYENSSEYSDLVLIHEFIHIAQADSDLAYLKEASAEIISHEYWDRPIISYQNAVKRIYALITILGPEVFWNANFTSNDQLISELSKYLTEDEVNLFIECLKTKPYNQKFNEETGIGEIDNKIDYLIKILYERKYNKPIDEDFAIKTIYNMDNQGNITYLVLDEEVQTPIYFFNKDKISKPLEVNLHQKTVK